MNEWMQKRLNVAKLVVVDLPGIKPCWLGLIIRPARKVSCLATIRSNIFETLLSFAIGL